MSIVKEDSMEYRIKKTLVEQDMTLTELAGQINLSVPYVSDLIKGKRDGPMAKKRIKVIKKILDIREDVN